MMDDAPVIYGLEDFQARALVAQAAETEKINFLVGTQSLRTANQVQLIEFDDDTNIVTKQAFEHPAGEIWRIASAPQSLQIIATVYNNTNNFQSSYGASLWKLPLESTTEGETQGNTVELLCELDAPNGSLPGVGHIWSVVWAPEDDSKLVTLVDSQIFFWDVQRAGSQAEVTSQLSIEGRSSMSFGVGRWYPHQNFSQIAATHGCNVHAWDIRSMKTTWSIESAHLQLVRDLDFNPNMQYYLATCGDDRFTKFWDVRNVQQPLLQLSDHSHWVWSVRFNPSYDQLVLTCSSDQRVILSNLPSIASQPFGTMLQPEEAAEDSKDRGEDGVIQVYEDHEDSVYAVEWSSADFWTFASLSYDGRLVINKVPRNVKYKQFM